MSESDVPASVPGEYNGDVKRNFDSTRLQFRGELFERNTIPVELYAPALLHYGRVFNRVHSILAPKTPRVTVEVQAEEGGSFIADVLVQVPDLWEATKAFLLSKDVEAIFKARDLIYIIVGLVAYKVFKHRAEGEVAESSIADGKIRCEDSNGNVLIVDGSVPQLAKDPTILRELAAFTEPLEADGVDSIEIKSSSSGNLISASDREAFIYESDLDEEEEVEATEEVVWPIGTTFDPSIAWTFEDATKRRFRAKMKDERFLDSVRSGEEHIRSGDRMSVRMHTTVYRDNRRPLREIVLVLGHKPNQEEPLPLEL